MSENLVDVFPITKGIFGFRPDWINVYVPKMTQPAYLLVVLLLVISIGIMALKRFENSDLETKLFNIPIIIAILGIWPFIVLGLKDLVDLFNTFLVQEIFQIPWDGFGFPSLGSAGNILGWSAESLAKLLPNLSYWIIYAFYTVFVFFFVVLGPFVLAKGVLYDEVDAFLALLKEVTILFLWQTTLVILVAIVLPEIVSGKPFPSHTDVSIYFLSLVLGIMILFVPSLTNKIGNHLGSSFFPPGVKEVGTLMAVGTLARGLSAIGAPVTAHKWTHLTHHAMSAHEIKAGYIHRKELLSKNSENKALKQEVGEQREELRLEQDESDTGVDHRDSVVNLAARAKRELNAE